MTSDVLIYLNGLSLGIIKCEVILPRTKVKVQITEYYSFYQTQSMHDTTKLTQTPDLGENEYI